MIMEYRIEKIIDIYYYHINIHIHTIKIDYRAKQFNVGYYLKKSYESGNRLERR